VKRFGLPDSIKLAGVERSLVLAAVLAVFAAITGWTLWLQEDRTTSEVFAGPPRSDYVLHEFTMTALDTAGKLSFVVDAPRLAKHTQLDTFAIDEPRFRIIDGTGNTWKASSRTAWVGADAKELRLSEAVAADRSADADTTPLSLRTERLTALLESSRMLSDAPVTITQPGLILRGTGLDADLAQNRFTLLADVKARYETPRP
jgi:lipopolysaccharide export system protein LptC